MRWLVMQIKNVSVITKKDISYALFNKKSVMIKIGICSLMIVVCAILLLINKDYVFGGIFLIIGLSLLPIMQISSEVAKKRALKKISFNGDVTFNYEFYDEYFCVSDSVERFYYKDIIEAREDKRNLYLYIKEGVFIVKKDAFLEGQLDVLVDRLNR